MPIALYPTCTTWYFHAIFLFFAMCEKLINASWYSISHFENDLIFSHCRAARCLLSNDEGHRDAVLEEFMSFTAQPDATFFTLKKWYPWYLSGYFDETYRALSPVLCGMYRALACPARIERKHRVKRHVKSERRGRHESGNVD